VNCHKIRFLNQVTQEQTFLERVDRSQGIIHRICRIYCKEEEDRKDLFQEILIQLWKSYGSFQGKSKFSTWVYRVSLNVAIQHLRSKGKKPRQVALSPQLFEIAEGKNEDFDEKLKWLKATMDQFSTIDKVIVMLYLEDKNNDEIAEIVGISQNYVRVKMNRIKSKLKKISKTSYYGD